MTLESKYLAKALKYISENIVPVLLVPIFVGVFYIYGTVMANSKDIAYAKDDIDRISKDFHGRIMSNQISIRDVGNRVTEIGTSLPLILLGIGDIKKDVQAIRKDLSKMEVTTGILSDRENRRNFGKNGAEIIE